MPRIVRCLINERTHFYKQYIFNSHRHLMRMSPLTSNSNTCSSNRVPGQRTKHTYHSPVSHYEIIMIGFISHRFLRKSRLQANAPIKEIYSSIILVVIREGLGMRQVIVRCASIRKKLADQTVLIVFLLVYSFGQFSFFMF